MTCRSHNRACLSFASAKLQPFSHPCNTQKLCFLVSEITSSIPIIRYSLIIFRYLKLLKMQNQRINTYFLLLCISQKVANFALGNQRRAPALRADTHYFLRARMLCTLHSEINFINCTLYMVNCT